VTKKVKIKKTYRKPEITQVKLVVEEVVLAVCKLYTISSGPETGTNCQAVPVGACQDQGT